jgi:hypothetical protein
MQESTSDLLRDNCDEFIYYEDLGRAPTLTPDLSPQLPETKRKAFALLMESMLALRRENKEVLWSSMIKDTMKRKKPSFNEAYHGYRTFSELLEDAQKEGLLELETDKRSRTYVVTRFGSEMNAPAPEAAPSRKKGRRRRSSKKARLAGRADGDRAAAERAAPGPPPAEDLFEAAEAPAEEGEALAEPEGPDERERARPRPAPAAEEGRAEDEGPDEQAGGSPEEEALVGEGEPRARQPRRPRGRPGGRHERRAERPERPADDADSRTGGARREGPREAAGEGDDS